MGQPTMPTQPSIPPGSANEQYLISTYTLHGFTEAETIKRQTRDTHGCMAVNQSTRVRTRAAA